MKKMIMFIAIMTLVGCKVSQQNTIFEYQNDPITVSADYEVKIGTDNIKNVKKYKDNYFYIESTKVEYNNTNNTEEYIPEQLCMDSNDDISIITQSVNFQGNINNYIVNDKYILYTDYSPYDNETSLFCINRAENKKETLELLPGMITSMYYYDDSLYFVNENDHSEIIKKNLSDNQNEVIGTYDETEIMISGYEDCITFSDKQNYYIYDGEITSLQSQYTIKGAPILYEKTLYCREKSEERGFLIIEYNLVNNEIKEYDCSVTDNYLIAKDYIISNDLDEITLYSLKEDEILKIYEEAEDISIYENELIILKDSFDLAIYSLE